MNVYTLVYMHVYLSVYRCVCVCMYEWFKLCDFLQWLFIENTQKGRATRGTKLTSYELEKLSQSSIEMKPCLPSVNTLSR